MAVSSQPITKCKNLAAATGICRPRLPVLRYAFCNVTELQNAGLPIVRSQTDEKAFRE